MYFLKSKKKGRSLVLAVLIDLNILGYVALFGIEIASAQFEFRNLRKVFVTFLSGFRNFLVLFVIFMAKHMGFNAQNCYSKSLQQTHYAKRQNGGFINYQVSYLMV